jgi:hypothetical protein
MNILLLCYGVLVRVDLILRIAFYSGSLKLSVF